MKIINLIGPSVIDGAVRYPIEGPLTVTDEEAQRQKDSGRLDGEPEDAEEADDGEDDGLGDLKVDELKKYAADNSIDLGTAKSKAEIIAAIRAAGAGEE